MAAGLRQIQDAIEHLSQIGRWTSRATFSPFAFGQQEDELLPLRLGDICRILPLRMNCWRSSFGQMKYAFSTLFFSPNSFKTASQGHMKQIELADPHGGFDEIDKAAKQARRDLLDADEVLANMTGGTTLMGLIVQRLVEEAQKLDRTVRRFALIDRRLPVEQDSDPFVQSNCHWLDD